MRLLVTRPLPQAEETARALLAKGHEVLMAPLLTIAPDIRIPLDPGSAEAIVLTSRAAVRAVSLHPELARVTGLPVFAVGEATAEAARRAGFAEVRSADGDLHALARLIAALPVPPRALLHLCGRERAGDLAALLADAGVTVETRVIYAAQEALRLPHDAVVALANGAIDGVLSFSPRSAETLVRSAGVAGVAEPLLAARHFCLSEAVAEVVRKAGAGDVVVAAHPDQGSLLALIPQV